MNFWNDYEGKTIAGNYPLQKLLYPEGRSGFFATSNGTGTPAVLRLTETLNDQEEIFQQWDKVRRLAHPHLITIRNYGPTVVDDTPLIYALLEPPDITLAEVLVDRPMTGEETQQIAASLVPALRAIHSAGMVHGHIEPGNVFAVGETIKLRSDCVRKLPEGPEGVALIEQDTRDLATLLLIALTRQRNADRLSGLAPSVPIPLAGIIRNGIDGTWTLEEMSNALQPDAKPATPAMLPAKEAVEPPRPIQTPLAPASSPLTENLPDQQLLFAEPIVADADEDPLPSRFAGRVPRAAGIYLAVAIALIVAISLWYVFHPMTAQEWALAHPARKDGGVPTISTADSAPRTASAVALVQPGGAAPAPSSVVPVASTPAVDRPQAKAAETTGSEQWRVVAFTYNQEDQARKKVASLERRHHSLHPEVFTPSGGAPYLVTLGGPLNHDQAILLKKKARSNGMPRDTYAQNYPAQ